MTEEFAVAKTPVFDPPFAPERHFKAKNAPPDHYFASYKRHITHRWCSRLSARGVPDQLRIKTNAPNESVPLARSVIKKNCSATAIRKKLRQGGSRKYLTLIW